MRARVPSSDKRNQPLAGSRQAWTRPGRSSSATSALGVKTMRSRGRKSARARVALAAMIRFTAGIWRRAWIVALATAGAALAAHVAVAHHPRVHEAKAVLLVGPLKAGIDTLRASGPLAETYAELAGSRPVLAALV